MTPAQIETERGKFESWFSATADFLPHLLKKQKTKPSEYAFLTVQASWEGWLAAKADQVEVTDGPRLHVRKYQVGDSQITVEWRGAAMWAVCRSGACLADDGEWEVESMPSNRTDDFIARCRFSLPEATRRAIEYVAALNPEGK